MPELPEVELAARSLRRWLVGHRVTAVTVFDARLAAPDVAEQWSAALVGQEPGVSSCSRRGREGRFRRLDLDRKLAAGLVPVGGRVEYNQGHRPIDGGHAALPTGRPGPDERRVDRHLLRG